MMLGRLLREAWRAWNKADETGDPGQEIVQLARTGKIGAALRLAKESGTDRQPDWVWLAPQLSNCPQEAEALLCLCLRRSGHDKSVIAALAHWYAAHGDPLRAAFCALVLQRLAPQEPSPFVLMGWLHLSLGNPRAARRQFYLALQRDENDREALHGYRQAVQQLTGRPAATTPVDEAREAELRQRIRDEPNEFSHHLALGRHYLQTSCLALALPNLRRARELAPGDVETAFWLATALAGLGNDREALDILSVSLTDHPQDADLLKLAAECALRLGQENEAIAWLLKVEAAGKADAFVYNNLGDGYNRLECFETAIPYLEKAVALDPTLPEARHNLAYALHCLGRYAEAYEHLEILLAGERNDFSARWYRATALLATHCFREGWQDYEFRFASTAVEGRLIPLPAWRGEPLANRKIVVLAEQGIGDEIMFASCLSELIRMTGQCVVECNRRLVALFRRSFPEAEIVEWVAGAHPPWLERHDDADFHVFCGSLPLHFRQTVESFGQVRPYLVADAKQVAHFRARLAELGEGLKVGLAWRGGAKASRARTRSLGLARLRPLFDIPGCRFVSLQYGDCIGEIEEHHRQGGPFLPHWPEAIADLDAFAALVAAVDLVVTVCSAPVHFAGGLGKTALVLTPFAPEWRYRGIDGRMIWYQSVRLFPQPVLGDWTGAVRAVADQLTKIAAGHAA